MIHAAYIDDDDDGCGIYVACMQGLRDAEPRDAGDVDGEGERHAAEQGRRGLGDGRRQRRQLVFVGGCGVNGGCAAVGGS